MRRFLPLSFVLVACAGRPGPDTPATEPHPHHHAGGHHRFEDAEAWAAKFDDPARDAWQKPEAVVAFIAPAPDAVVADLGAGTGYFAMRLADAVPEGRVLANDIEPDMVRYLGERAQKEGRTNVTPVQGSADAPALPQPADVVFLCNVYHHIGDRAGYFTAVREQLAAGGRLVIVDFRKDADADAPGPPPAMRVAHDTLIAELTAAGWTHARSDRETLPHQYIAEFTPTP
ncbi:MAG: class I SAM-dependent methyltransferase [Myxococcota bacterium]